jgi:hypothetical protein
MLGRASVEVPQVKFEGSSQLTRRLQFIEETKKQFWDKWMQQVFKGRVLSHKWKKEKRDVAVGDVVQLAEAENDDPTYRLGVIEEAKKGEDGHVRTVVIRYANPGRTPQERSTAKTTTRPIHKIAVLVPIGYVFEDDKAQNEMAQEAVGRPSTPEAGGDWEEETETASTPSGPPPEATHAKRKPGRPKKITSHSGCRKTCTCHP